MKKEKKEITSNEKIETSVTTRLINRVTDEEEKHMMAARAYSRLKGMWFTAFKMSLIPAVPPDVADSRSAADISVDHLTMWLTKYMIEDILKPSDAGRCKALLRLCNQGASSAIEILKNFGVNNLLQFYLCDFREVDGLHPWTKERIIELKLRLAGEDYERTPASKEDRKGRSDEKAI